MGTSQIHIMAAKQKSLTTIYHYDNPYNKNKVISINKKSVMANAKTDFLFYDN